MSNPYITQNWQLTKAAATGRRGIVVSQSKDAATAGVEVLNAGGNAVDAAVATALALAAVEPWNSGLGGTGFALVHRAGQSTADVVDFGPAAPKSVNPSAFRLTGNMKSDLFAWPEVEGDKNIHGPLSFAIPSAGAGYAHMHDLWGRLPLSDVIAPAISLARRGLPQDWFTTLKIAFSAAVLRQYPESSRIYLPNGLPPVPPYQGEPTFFRLGALADTLEQLGHAGLRDQYEGDVAAKIVSDVNAIGGFVSSEDLRCCLARVRPANVYPWRGQEIQTAGGLTAAPTMRRVLQQMESIAIGKTPDGSWFAALGRALKQAYAERLAGLGDVDVNVGETCTSHLTVCDADGAMVSMTTTLLSSMGSRVVLPGTGILMNNGMMWFDPRPDQPNSIAAGKRPLTNMSPVIVKHAGQPWLAAGASGGRRILASVAQLLLFVMDFGMDLNTAAHLPRIDVSDPDTVSVDARMDRGIIDALAREGRLNIVEHRVMPINFACPNAIVSSSDGNRVGISDAASPWSAAIAQT